MSMNPPDFAIARWSFSVAAFILAARVAWWLATERPDVPNGQSLVVAVLIYAAIGGLWMASINWVHGREPQPMLPPSFSAVFMECDFVELPLRVPAGEVLHVIPLNK